MFTINNIIKLWVIGGLWLTACFLPLMPHLSHAEQPTPLKIVTLAPHLAEVVAQLGAAQHLIAVSEATDYPSSAINLPTVANHRGVALQSIIQLQPTHILAWQGGNRDSDIQRLRQLGLNVLSLSVEELDDIADQARQVGQFIGVDASLTVNNISTRINDLRQRYQGLPIKEVFYYSYPKPLMSIGKHAWPTRLLSECRISHLFDQTLVAYPQVQLSKVIRQQPAYVIAATGQEDAQTQAFWQRYRSVIDVQIITANPDKLHRFSGRVLDELERVCDAVHELALRQ